MADNPGWKNITPLTSETAKVVGAKGGAAKKGSKHINTWIQELLNDEEFVTQIREGSQVKEYKGAPIKAIIKAQIRLAIDGDTKAADMLFKHGGVQKQEIDITSNGEQISKPLDVDVLTNFLSMAKDQTKQ